MSFAKVQYAANNNTGNTVLTVTLGAGTTQHNLLVVTHSNDGGTSPGAVPTSISLVGTGQNLTMITSTSQTNGTASIVKSIWYLKDIPAGATQLTATIAATNGQLMEVEEFSGADTTAPLITNAFSAASAPANTQQTSYDSTAAAGSTPAASLWVMGFTGIDSGTHPTINTSQGYTLEASQNPGSSSMSQLGYILSSSAAAPQVSGSITAPAGGAWWSSVVAGFAAQSTTSNISVSDVAAQAESLSLTATVPLSEVAAQAETRAITVTAALSETGAALESLSANVSLVVSDVAAALDLETLIFSIAFSDYAGAVESLSGSVTISIRDVAAALDRENINTGIVAINPNKPVLVLMAAEFTGP